jgi:ATP-dependent DNA ligase
LRHAVSPVAVQPQTLGGSRQWLQAAGSGSDGVIAKRRDLPYQFGNREGMQKIKKHRSADCVIGGFRYGERRVARGKVVGSLLLGLSDDDGLLHHVGFTSALKEADKPDGHARSRGHKYQLHGERAGRSQPLVDQAFGRVGGGQAKAGRRSKLRPLHRRPVSTWYDNFAVAA